MCPSILGRWYVQQRISTDVIPHIDLLGIDTKDDFENLSRQLKPLGPVSIKKVQRRKTALVNRFSAVAAEPAY